MKTSLQLRKVVLLPLFFFTTYLLPSIHSQTYLDYIGAGHNNGITVTSSGNASGSDSLSTINGHGIMVDTFGASRFLAQATLGANYAEIHRTANIGVSAWIDEQFAMPIDSLQTMHDSLKQIFNDSLVADGMAAIPLMSPNFKQFVWWQSVMTSDAQLRHRVTTALTEIFVVDGGAFVLFPRASANYYDMLQTNAFGNWRDLFRDVTLHPAMGVFLSHLQNRKTDLSINRFPDENYARESMQLFSIGLHELNNDGNPKTDANGNFIPTFDSEDITEAAKVLTGLSFNWPVFNTKIDNVNTNYYEPMKMFEEHHEQGQKVILKNNIIPDGQTGMEDIEDFVDILFNHPNTGPFFCKFMIQRLVTSNPSSGYIDRVASVFNDNGAGIRGDMKSVIKAILLDNEARDCSFRNDITYGRMKEPIIKFVEQVRAFSATSSNGTYLNRTTDFRNATGQRVLSSPSVFNFFQSDFQPAGQLREMGLVAPEFHMLNSFTSVGFHNYMYKGFAGDNAFEDRIPLYDRRVSGIQLNDNYTFDFNEGRVLQNFSVEQAMFDNNQIEALINRLDLLLTHGDMSDATKDTIRDLAIGLNNTTHGTQRLKLGFILEMVILSPEYNIIR